MVAISSRNYSQLAQGTANARSHNVDQYHWDVAEYTAMGVRFPHRAAGLNYDALAGELHDARYEAFSLQGHPHSTHLMIGTEVALERAEAAARAATARAAVVAAARDARAKRKLARKEASRRQERRRKLG